MHTVQITRLKVDKPGVTCTRRAVRGLKSSFSEATADVTVLTVFQKGQDSKISLDKLASMAGVQAVTPLDVSAKVDTAADAEDKSLR